MKHAFVSSIVLVPAALAAACGNNGSSAPDDAAADAVQSPTADAANGSVVVTVVSSGVPVAGVLVYFQRADSSLVLAATTDGNGTVGALVPRGGSVTIVHPPSNADARALTTFAGVVSNDQLRVDIAPVDARGAVVVPVSVPTFGGAAAYQVMTSCGEVDLDAGGATAAAQLVGCDGVADAVVVALDGNASPVAGYFVANVAIQDGLPPALNGTYQALATTTIDYTNVPPTISVLEVYRALATARGRLDAAFASAPNAGGTAATSVALPVAATAIALTVTDAFPMPTEISEQLVYEWGPTTGSYALDVGAALLARYSTPPSFDAATHALSWQEAAGVVPDFVRLRVRATRDTIPVAQVWTWRIVAPRASIPAIEFPQLPTDGVDFNLLPRDTLVVEELTSVKLPGGYDAFRTRGFDDVTTAVAGASGRIVVELPYAPAL